MPPQIELQGATIVVLGRFNPAIFHPAWFAANALIRAQEASDAKIEITHPEVAVFTAAWLQVNCTRDRFQAATAEEAYNEPLRDLVLGVLALLSHTPVTAIGLNRDFHYRVPSVDYWHNVGHRLAPKDYWEGILNQAGLRTLVMQGERSDEYAGNINVSVGPSTRVHPGLVVTFNDHYEWDEKSSLAEGTEKVQVILNSNWTKAIDNGRRIAEHLASLGEP